MTEIVLENLALQGWVYMPHLFLLPKDCFTARVGQNDSFMPTKTQTEMLRDLAVRLFPLPPPEKRQKGFPPVKWLHPGIQLKRDVDYLCYLLLQIILLIGTALLVLMLLDIWFRTGLFFDPEEFRKNQLLLPAEFSRIMGPVAFGMTILFYIRVRVAMDLKNDELLVLMHRAILLGYSRRRWIFRSLFGISIGLICIFLSHIVVMRITLHYEMQDSLEFILILQIFQLLGPSGGSLVLLSYSLVLEKAVRFFSNLEYDLRVMADYQQKQ